jgi:hypothetical protein
MLCNKLVFFVRDYIETHGQQNLKYSISNWVSIISLYILINATLTISPPEAPKLIPNKCFSIKLFRRNVCSYQQHYRCSNPEGHDVCSNDNWYLGRFWNIIVFNVANTCSPKPEKHSRSLNFIVLKTAAQLVEALSYKPEGRGFDSRWCHWNFSVTYSLEPHYGSWIDSASKRNEYQDYFLGVKVAGAYG